MARRKRSRREAPIIPDVSATQKTRTNVSENAKKRVVKCRKSIINYWATRFSSSLLLLSVFATICSGAGEKRKNFENFLLFAVMSADAFWCDRVNHQNDVRWKIFPRTCLSLPIKMNFSTFAFFECVFFRRDVGTKIKFMSFTVATLVTDDNASIRGKCRKWNEFKVM